MLFTLVKLMQPERILAKIEIDKLTAHITFSVNLEDIEKYVNNGFIIVQKRK